MNSKPQPHRKMKFDSLKNARFVRIKYNAGHDDFLVVSCTKTTLKLANIHDADQRTIKIKIGTEENVILKDFDESVSIQSVDEKQSLAHIERMKQVFTKAVEEKKKMLKRQSEQKRRYDNLSKMVFHGRVSKTAA